MKILHLSDTHGCHRRLANLPEADATVHSGDFTRTGSEQEALDFLNWFCDLPYPHKIFICGNHDNCLRGATIDGLDSTVHYLCNSGVEIDGVKFYGVPLFMGDCISGRQARNIGHIPTDTDVLITHSPAYGILDFDEGIHYGNQQLLAKVLEIRPRLHLFGHIHTQHGVTTEHGIVFSNGVIMNAGYTHLNSPHIFTI
ncbi:metallophosphoesterase [uncultured Rikenella sp.]|uniref:metallophosphoesterase family protein n=1 Tax=uncultured Rikenella sp. TaxID=368003 RepID=UPI00260D75E7|nr:metallophosphoesterase [uncultured Rikenella sp.]